MLPGQPVFIRSQAAGRMPEPLFLSMVRLRLHLKSMKAKRGEFSDLQRSNEPPLPITAFPDSISALSSAISASPRFDETIWMRQPCRRPPLTAASGRMNLRAFVLFVP
jgi:hypothetical protein